MSAKTTIEWTDHTFNPWIGCTKVSPGCAHCYAETRDKRHLIEKVDHWGKGAPRYRTSESYWKQALRWDGFVVYECPACGQRYFVNRGKDIDCGWECLCSAGETVCRGPRRPRVFPSLCDWLDNEVQIEWLADFLNLIHLTPNLDWQLLTKRPELWRMRLIQVVDSRHAPHLDNMLKDWLLAGNAPSNVWLGVSVEDQTRADERIPLLMQTPAAIRFLSCEPLLGPVHLSTAAFFSEKSFRKGIHWVIVGGESGTKARPCNVQWIRNIFAQCKAAAVPVFVKQLGAEPYDQAPYVESDPHFKGWTLIHLNEQKFWVRYYQLAERKGGDWNEWPEDLRVREMPLLSASTTA